MRKNKLVLMICLAITSILLTLPIKSNTPIQLSETFLDHSKVHTDVFFVETWIQRAVFIDPVWAAGIGFPYRTGDKFNYTITTINITNCGTTGNWLCGDPIWIALCIWGTEDYYNASTGMWTIYPTEYGIAAYDPTYPYYIDDMGYGGVYYSAPGWGAQIIPLNFTAANHTIVNTSYSYYKDPANNPLARTFSHIDPSSIDGTWELWIGDGTNPNDEKIILTYNELGIMMTGKFYMGSINGWVLVNHRENISFETQEEEEISMELMLLALMAGGGGGGDFISSTGPFVGILAGAGLGVGLLIGLLIGRRK